jgi:large subunit ribosomal protein L4
MVDVPLFSKDGKRIGSVLLPDEIFGIEPNRHVMHQVVVAQLAAARAGTHSVKRRSEVRGGGAKPWRQKGTGRARAGSIRSPLWVGGARAHGPKPRDYSKRVPKKVKRLALRSALSDLASSGNILVIEKWPFENEPKTKVAKTLLEQIGLNSRSKVLVCLDREENLAFLSVRNLPKAHPLYVDQLNTYDVVNADVMTISLSALETFVSGQGLRIERKDSEEPADAAESGLELSEGDPEGERAEEAADSPPAGSGDKKPRSPGRARAGKRSGADQTASSEDVDEEVENG